MKLYVNISNIPDNYYIIDVEDLRFIKEEILIEKEMLKRYLLEWDYLKEVQIMIEFNGSKDEEYKYVLHLSGKNGSKKISCCLDLDVEGFMPSFIDGETMVVKLSKVKVFPIKLTNGI